METAVRLSHSYPPNYSDNTKYFAQVHSILEKLQIEIDPKNIYYREMKFKEELEEVKLLHKEWFPLDYPDSFFNSLLQNIGTKCILALHNFEYQDQVYSVILGCITYEYKCLDYDIARFSFSDLCVDKSGIYILTFGVINEARKLGVGTVLINKLVELAKEDYETKYVYLDVVSYNDLGIKCYERNGFVRLYKKEKYYSIFGSKYDAIVYSRYINDCQRPLTAKEVLCNCLTLCGIPNKIFGKVKNKINKLCEMRRRSVKYKELKV